MTCRCRSNTTISSPGGGSSGGLLVAEFPITLLMLQALGSVVEDDVNAATNLPDGAQVVAWEINVSEPLAGPGLASSSGETTTDVDATPGSVIGAVDLMAGGTSGPTGTKLYFSRGGQNPSIHITNVGCFFADLTAGAFTIRALYNQG